MGQENEAMLSYLEDNRRFADLFNQLYFGGRPLVEADKLTEASEVYHGKPIEKSPPRTRDIKKCLKYGKELKILAVECQSEVNYSMPWRIMDYDCREYSQQIRKAQKANSTRVRTEEHFYENAGERLGQVRKTERLIPVYTLCLYHGAEPWDGPRSLKDMMEFGEEQVQNSCTRDWADCFADYPMRLVSVCDPMDCSGFQTSLHDLFTILPYRRDKKLLKKLLAENPAYRKMDEETAQTLSILMGIKKFSVKSEKYKSEKGEYNMCQAIQEMMEDSRHEGFAEGEVRGEAMGGACQIIEIIDSIMHELHCSLEKACEVGGKTLTEYQQAKAVYSQKQQEA